MCHSFGDMAKGRGFRGFPVRALARVALRNRLLAGSALGSAWAACALAAQNPNANAPREQVIIEAPQPDDYKLDLPALSKLTEPLVDTPQSIDVISGAVLQDRAVTNLNDALRNVPGITLGAGEFEWQGNNPSIRGFVARNDMFLDGLRDFGSYYRDPFNLDQISVLEGPSSVLFGRGSAGGVIDQVSKSPSLDGFVSGTLIGGSDYTRRATVDIDEAVPELGPDAAFRLNAMVHAQSVSGRNIAKDSRFGLAPSLALGLGTPTRLIFSYFDQTANDVPDYGVPWFGTSPAPVPRQTFYGLTSDYLKTGTDIGTFTIEHDFRPGLMLRNVVRYANYTREFRISEPIITAPLGTPLSQINASLDIWSGNSAETMGWDQAQAVIKFQSGPLSHTLVAGIEGGRESSSPEFDNSSGVPPVPLLDPNPHRPFIATATFPRVIANTIAWSFAPYALDTVKIGRQWEISGGIRWDYFASHYRATRYSATAPGQVTGFDDVPRVDTMPSFRGAVVYKPTANGSVYVDFGTSFDPSAEMLDLITSGHSFAIGNADLAPEKNQTVELGSKWEMLQQRLLMTGALFWEEKLNARVPDSSNPGFNMLAGTQRVGGFDLELIGRITENWQITAGYTYLDGAVTKSAPGAAPPGALLPNTPKNSLDFFSEYRLAGGFEIGAGGEYESSRLAQNTPPLRAVPGYWTFDAMGKYDVNDSWSVQLNVTNLLNTYYYDQIHPFHVVPGAGRTALLSLSFSY